MITRSYDELLKRLEAAALSPALRIRPLGKFESRRRTYEMVVAELGAPGPGKAVVVISAGIHGDEPAGGEAAVQFIERNVENTELLSRFHFTIFPCNNPAGYESGTRENAGGVDLNRQFLARKPESEVRIIMDALQGRCFDLVFEMHEDVDSPGFYLYEIADQADQQVGEMIVEAVASAGYPVNLNECIEGMPAHGGIIRRSINLKRFRKTRLPQAIYTYRTCGGHVLTLEPPASILSIEDRVRIELTGLEVALRNTVADGQRGSSDNTGRSHHEKRESEDSLSRSRA